MKKLSTCMAFVTMLVVLLLGGCAATAIEHNAKFVDDFAVETVGANAKWHKNSRDRLAAREYAEQLLVAPLQRDDAIKLALALSPTFQAMLSDTAAMSAMATQSARLTNPIFTFERLTRREGAALDIDIGRMLSVSILELIYLPSRLKVAETMQTAAQLRGALSVVEVADNVRQAWVRAVAAQQSLAYTEQVMDAAEASAELAKRMYKVGNFSKLQRARQQVFYADAAAQMSRATQSALSTREALIRSIGLDTALAEKLILPMRLPDLPIALTSQASVVEAGLKQRLDVQMAANELALVATKYGFTKAESYVNAFHLAAVRNSETGKPVQRGIELELAIPIFDMGDAKRGQAHAEYFAAMQRVFAVSINADSMLREHHAAQRAAYELSQHYRQEIVPLRKAIADEMLLKYNGMLVGVFDLLVETRAQISSIVSAIDAERDFWLADATLQASLLGKPAVNAAAAKTATPLNEAAGH